MLRIVRQPLAEAKPESLPGVPPLLQLRVLGFGLPQDGDVGVGVLRPRFWSRSRRYQLSDNCPSRRLNPRLDPQLLWGSNQADRDGRSAGADDRVRGVGRLAAPSNVEHRDVDVTAFRVGWR